MVDPAVNGVRLRKVLMNGGSGLNIIYVDTLKAMDIPLSRLSKSNMQFHGVIPGKKAESLSQITLSVVFGNEIFFCKERLTLEVVDFHNAYHTILGRCAYACFMACPCYMYIKLKMLGPKGVITMTANRKIVEECLQQGSKIANEKVLAPSLKGTRRRCTLPICSSPNGRLLSPPFSRPARPSRFTST